MIKLEPYFKCKVCGIVMPQSRRSDTGRNICKSCEQRTMRELKKLEPKDRTIRHRCRTCGKVDRGWWKREDEWECMSCLRKRANKTLGDDPKITLWPMYRPPKV